MWILSVGFKQKVTTVQSLYRINLGIKTILNRNEEVLLFYSITDYVILNTLQLNVWMQWVSNIDDNSDVFKVVCITSYFENWIHSSSQVWLYSFSYFFHLQNCGCSLTLLHVHACSFEPYIHICTETTRGLCITKNTIYYI